MHYGHRLAMFIVTTMVVASLNGRARADWLIRSYRDPGGPNTTNLAAADALIGGAQLQPGFPVSFNLAGGLNTQDNGFAAGQFGLGTQLAGLPPGENHDFAVQSLGAVTVATAGSYVFTNNSDDGSRLRLSINGGPMTTAILDDVNATPHNVSSSPITLSAGAQVSFEWTWFNRGGPGEGETFYSRNGGAAALLGNASQGLTPNTPSFGVTTYKSRLPHLITNFNDADAVRSNPAYRLGAAVHKTFNVLQTGASGDFPNDDPVPGLPGPTAYDDFVVDGSGVLLVSAAQAGKYVFRSNTDDGGRLRIDLNHNGKFESGETIIEDPTIAYPRNTDSTAVTLAAGSYRIEYTWFNHPGPAEGEISAQPADSPSSFVLLGDTANSGLNVIQPDPGDATGDRKVDFLDLAIMAQSYNTFTGGATSWTGDFNGDGNVDFLDLAILAQNYNKGPIGSAPQIDAVPEPGNIALIGLSAALALIRRRKRAV
jgi:hypothetical protein